jgi:hypothetical protein
MSEKVSEVARQQLRELHSLQLRLHKILMDGARAEYEDRNGKVSPNELLQLLISDSRFAWLRTISQLLADIDEVLSPRREGTEEQAQVLLRHARSLYFGSGSSSEFRAKYHQAMQENVEVVVLHGQIRKILDSVEMENGQ